MSAMATVKASRADKADKADKADNAGNAGNAGNADKADDAELPEETPELLAWARTDLDKSVDGDLGAAEAQLSELASSEAAADHDVKEEKATDDARPKRDWKSGAGKAAKLALAELGREVSGQRAGDRAAKSDLPKSDLTKAQSSVVRAAMVNARLQGPMSKQKAPDAFTLLKDAQEAGVLFIEDAERDGHSEDQDEPRLAAAVEECIRICFGVRGILRIGPGRDDQKNPVIVIIAVQGFTNGSLEKVPESVHGFPTMLAIPFELLPLRREG
jgi:hypothetical protein